tara:strand:+ start:166 stop:441 length:276 start_codon:yes stop_codon:yes gene_type:complete
MEVLNVIDCKVTKLPNDPLTIQIDLIAVVDLLNDVPELLETSFQYVPSEWPEDQPIKEHIGKPSKTLLEWLETLCSSPDDWWPSDYLNTDY